MAYLEPQFLLEGLLSKGIIEAIHAMLDAISKDIWSPRSTLVIAQDAGIIPNSAIPAHSPTCRFSKSHATFTMYPQVQSRRSGKSG
jgi:hypothetical protein